MDPLTTPALIRYSCEYFPSTTTTRLLLVRKEEIRLNLMVVSVLLKIKFGLTQIRVPKTVYRCQKHPVSTSHT